jgi:predicted DCC family thiol-disulfide oxidoreductase YuxK
MKKDKMAEPVILLIDGQCILCHGITRFVFRRDRRGRFRFASLQSPAGQWLLEQGGLSREDFDTFIMVDNGRYDTKSDAALRALRMLGGAWPMLYLFRFVPRPVRDRIYDFIAKRRHRWFGRMVCLVPAPGMRERFMEEKEEVAGYGEQANLR